MSRKDWSVQDYQKRLAELRGEFVSLSEGDRNAPDFAERRSGLLREVDDLSAEYDIARRLETRSGRGPVAATGQFDEEIRSVGDAVINSPEFRAWIDSGARGSSPMVELRTLVQEATGTGGANFLLPVGQPFLGNVREQRLYVRDLLNVEQTGLSQVPYVKELNPLTTESSASTVAEGALKPEAADNFQSAVAPTTVVAVSIPVTTQILQDAPTLMAYINNRLGYRIKWREEREILSGNGTYPDLEGLIPQATTATGTTGDPAISIGNAIATIEGVDGYPTGVVMNPADAWAMLTKRAASGSGTFDAGTPFSAVVDTVWGLPVVHSRSITAGNALVGDFKQGATLFDRLQSNVRVFEQHADFAARNQVLLLAEERIALATYRPDYFVYTTLP